MFTNILLCGSAKALTMFMVAVVGGSVGKTMPTTSTYSGAARFLSPTGKKYINMLSMYLAVIVRVIMTRNLLIYSK